MSLTNKTTTINDLCDDLLCQIFDRMSVKQVMAVQRVNQDFNRSARTWYKNVDKLNIWKKRFFLSKTNGKPIDFQRDGFRTPFDRIDKMLDTFSQIKNVDIFSCSTLAADQLVDLVSRFPNLKQISINFCKLNFDDTYWTCLVELIKHCDIHLKVHITSSSPNLVQHLEQLFAIAKKVKTVKFYDMTFETFMTIAGLDESTKVIFDFERCAFKDELTDDETRRFADLVSRHVESLNVKHSKHFHYLHGRRFLKLSQLEIEINQKSQFPFPFLNNPFLPSGFECPNLKRLTIKDYDGENVSKFFAEVPAMKQLEQLKILSSNFQINEEQPNAVVEKTANISELEVAWQYCYKPKKATVKFLVKLFQSLLYQTRLRTVSVVLRLVSADDFKQLIEPLTQFAEERPEANLRLEFHGGEEYKEFKRMTEEMPDNVEIKWSWVKYERR